MNELGWVPWFVLIGVPVGFAAILGLIFFAGRRRPQPGLGPTQVQPGQVATSGVWNVMMQGGPLRAMGGTAGCTTGRFEIADGRLTFVPDKSTAQAWSVPCPQITVQTSAGLFGQLGAGVTLWLPTTHIRCVVSRERINRFMSNDIKTARQTRYFAEFARTLAANGARYV